MCYFFKEKVTKNLSKEKVLTEAVEIVQTLPNFVQIVL